MLAAVTADPAGVLVAFGAGILSFLSPCVLPLVPGYVSMVSGLSAAELEAAPGSDTRQLGALFRGIALFVGGFTLVFVALGAAASGLGHLLGSHKQQLTMAAGALMIGFGLVLLVGALPPGRGGGWATPRRAARAPGRGAPLPGAALCARGLGGAR